MKIPSWLVGLISTVLAALVIAAFAWAWELNAQTASNKVKLDNYNTSMIEFKGNIGAAFIELGKRFDKIDNKLDHLDRRGHP